MSDFLIELGQRPAARKFIQTVGLPTPEELVRGKGSWSQNELAGLTIAVGGHAGSTLSNEILSTVGAAGGNAVLLGYDDTTALYSKAGEATGVKAEVFAPHATPKKLKANGLVYDGTGITDPAALPTVQEFFTPWVRKLAKSGRIVVLANTPDSADTPAAKAIARGLEGLARALAKEVGKKGATGNIIYVEKGAEDRVAPVLRWVLSPRSAFVSGQPFVVTSQAQAATDVVEQPLAGKVALVTGGARGIGAATARRLREEGAKLIILDLPSDDLNNTAKELDADIIEKNMVDADAPEVIANLLKEKHGGVDIVVHNAGITRDKTMAGMKPHLWNMVMEVNLAAILRVDEALLDGVVNDGGRLTYLASISGVGGNAGQTNYGLTKAALIGYVKAISDKLAADKGITANAVAPGMIETKMTDAVPFMIREVARRISSVQQGGQPVDVAELIAFFSSPGAYGITGTTVRCCGQNLMGA